MKNRITIRDVARAANVSIATVSKALNGVDVVRPETKERVLAAANELHYVPNLMGKQLKNAKSNVLGFYTTSISGPYFSVLVDAIARAAGENGYALNVFISGDKKVVLNNILGGVFDGFIGFEDLLDQEDLAAIKREKIKGVFIDRNIVDETFGSVVFDSFQKGKLVTEYLLELGHKKIAFIDGIEGVYDSDERFQGYQAALENAEIAIDPELILPGFFEESAAYEEVTQFLKSYKKELPTAFLAGNDLSAIGTAKAVHSAGFKVPENFSVVGFDGIDLLDYFVPKLTTVKNPIMEQGALAVSHLMELIHEEATGKSFVLEGTLIEGQSVKAL